MQQLCHVPTHYSPYAIVPSRLLRVSHFEAVQLAQLTFHQAIADTEAYTGVAFTVETVLHTGEKEQQSRT